MTKKRMLVIDMAISKRSPAGSCVLREVDGLADIYDITLFSTKYEGNSQIKMVKIPLPSGPVLLRYILFQAIIPVVYLLWRLRGNRADIIQGTQGQFVGADIIYAHFCHHAYLADGWKSSPVTGIRRLARFLNHQFNAIFERRAISQAKKIVVPSSGLLAEIETAYPDVKGRVSVIPNPVDITNFICPVGFDKLSIRRDIGIDESAVLFAFVALGDFARKGLGIIFEAMATLEDELNYALLVVGGKSSEIETFRKVALEQGVADRVKFVGMQDNVAPFLWAADAFVFPSLYETFSLVIFQAAAAGLPVIMTQGLHGASELIVDGMNGYQVERSAVGVGEKMREWIIYPDRLSDLANNAEKSTTPYAINTFVEKWKALLSVRC